MRFLALQTNPDTFKQEFLNREEDLLIATHCHISLFIVRMLVPTIVTVALILAAISLLPVIESEAAGFALTLMILAWFGFYALYGFKIYVDYRYDFIIVTSEKLILIDHTFFLQQDVRAVNIQYVVSVETTTQFWGALNVGTVVVVLEEPDAAIQKLELQYVPYPRELAGYLQRIHTAIRKQMRAASKHVNPEEQI